MTTIRRVAAIVLVAAAVLVSGAGPALAADATGADYSAHVRQCQQATGFSGTHNPGVMHRGFSGWDPDHTC